MTEFASVTSDSCDIFLSPWHICIHGLSPRGHQFDHHGSHEIAELLVSFASDFKTRKGIPYQDVIDYLIRTLLSAEGMDRAVSAGLSKAELLDQVHTMLESANDPEGGVWLASRVVSYLGRLEPKAESASALDDLLHAAFQKITSLDVTSERLQYERLMLMLSLFDAAAASGLQDYFESEGTPSIYLQWFLQHVESLRDPFLRVRCSATAYSLLAASGLAHYLNIGPNSHLERLLVYLDLVFREGWTRAADEIHQPNDYEMFSLSLLLAAMAKMGNARLICWPRDWVALFKSVYARLDIRSRASQFLFYEKAKRLLGIGNTEELRTEFVNCLAEYTSSPHTKSADAYLRYCYVVLGAKSLACDEYLTPSLWDAALEAFLQSLKGSSHSHKYLNPGIVTGYAFCALRFDSERLRRFLVTSDFRGFFDPAGSSYDHSRPCLRILNNALLDTAWQLRKSIVRANKAVA